MLILASAFTGCVSIFTFASLVCVPAGITSSAIKLKIYAIPAGIKKYKSIIKKKKEKRKKHNKLSVVRKKLDTIEFLISYSLMDSHISHDEFVSVNNVFREYNEIKEEIKNPETSVEYFI